MISYIVVGVLCALAGVLATEWFNRAPPRRDHVPRLAAPTAWFDTATCCPLGERCTITPGAPTEHGHRYAELVAPPARPFLWRREAYADNLPRPDPTSMPGPADRRA